MMTSSLSAWLDQLAEQAQAHQLTYFDLLIDATGLPTPLPPPQGGQPCAWLFDGTPEQALAKQGPHLRRIQVDDERPGEAVQALIAATGPERLLAVFSPWSFEALAAHLSHCTQAHWGAGQAKHSGLFRFYDPRLFLACCETLLSAQNAWFQALALAWHWHDRDGQPRQLVGQPRAPREVPKPLPALTLNEQQVFELQAWSKAVRFSKEQALIPQAQGLSSQEALLRHLVHGLWAAQREQGPAADHEVFLQSWLERHAPQPA